MTDDAADRPMTFWPYVRSWINWGIGAATLLSLWAGLLSLVNKSLEFKRLGLTLPVIIALYYFGGITAGAVVGMLRPLTRTAIGSMFVGWVAFLPLYAAADLMRYKGSIQTWWPTDWVIVLEASLVIGPVVGYVVWSNTIKGKAVQPGK